jgi:TolA-binding protein
MEQTYTSEEIRQLLLYVKEMQDVNEDLRAGIIAMEAKLANEESKVRQLRLKIQELQYILVNYNIYL